MATQNPIEHEGVYPLPEAQRDRFLFKINVDYPSPEEEREIIYRMGVTPPQPKQILAPGRPAAAAGHRGQQLRAPRAGRLCGARRRRHPRPRATRHERRQGWIAFGASPRASLGIIAAARSLALIRGRDYVIPQDVVEVIPDVLRHRLVLTYDALADEISPEIVINRVLQTVALPQVNAVPQQGHSVPPGCRPRARLAVGDRFANRRAVVHLRRRCSAAQIDDPKLSAALRTLELTVKRKLDGVLHGDHLGLIPGPGSEPGESRLYQPGDDVRRMDWAVTARTTHPHVRQMIADRELETWLVVDVSASLDFGTAGLRETRPGGCRRGGHHLPQQRWRQPARCSDRQRRQDDSGAGALRPSAPADAAAHHRDHAQGAVRSAR